MSYCVNCGVELDKTCEACPLCQTPVYNPNQPVDTKSPTPYPTKKGSLEPVKRYEFTILMSIILGTTSLVCLFLNRFVFATGNWSIYVLGFCAVLWVFLMPVFFPNTIRMPFSLIFNGISIAAYLGAISWLHPGNGWYQDIALPITLLATVLVLLQYLFAFRRRHSLITRIAWPLGSLAALCVSIELLIRIHYQLPIRLSWAAVVFTCCISIDIVLIAIYFLKGIREEIRRRMHF